jgi:hypothetical protein
VLRRRSLARRYVVARVCSRGVRFSAKRNGRPRRTIAGPFRPCRLMLLIRAPVLAVKWILVGFSVLLWVVFAPIAEIFGEIVARVRRFGGR